MPCERTPSALPAEVRQEIVFSRNELRSLGVLPVNVRLHDYIEAGPSKFFVAVADDVGKLARDKTLGAWEPPRERRVVLTATCPGAGVLRLNMPPSSFLAAPLFALPPP